MSTDNIPPRGPFWRPRAWVRHYLPGSDDGSLPDELKEHVSYDDVLKEEYLSLSVKETNNKQNDEHSSGDDHHDSQQRKYPKLWELAKAEGDSDWIEWLGKHIWTYVGLAAPLLGAPSPLRSVLSGENMGLPFTDEEARTLELCEFHTYV